MSPYRVLGVAENASEEEIRAAYLAKVREFPPDRAPEEFERIRDAWNSLRDPRAAFLSRLLSTDFSRPLVHLVDEHGSRRNFAGPKLWREALKRK